MTHSTLAGMPYSENLVMACILPSGLLEMLSKSKFPAIVVQNIHADLVDRAQKYVAIKVLQGDSSSRGYDSRSLG